MTDFGTSPDPVGLGVEGALVDDFTGCGDPVLVLTGAELEVVEWTTSPAEVAVESVVAVEEPFEEAIGAATEVAGETVPPAQLVALVAKAGPDWIGLQPGNWSNAPFLPMSWLMTGAMVHACLAASLWTEPAPKHWGESNGSPVLPMSQLLIAFAKAPGSHPFSYKQLARTLLSMGCVEILRNPCGTRSQLGHHLQ